MISMDLLNGESGSSNETLVASTHDGKEVIGVEADRVSDISEVAGQETTTPAIKTEPNVQTASTYRRRDEVCPETSVTTSKPMTMNDLPDDILLHFLSYFGPEDLCIIAKVSKRLNEFAKEVLRKTHSYDCDHSSNISVIKEVLTAAPAVHSLIIFGRDDVADILKLHSDNCDYLRKLVLQRCYLGWGRSDLLASIVALYPDLEVLSLMGHGPLRSDDYCLITRLKKLSELKIAYRGTRGCGLDGNTVRLIAESCQQLKKLILEGVTGILDDDIIHVIDRLGKQLTTLVLDGGSLTDVAYSYLKNCSRLQELELTSCAGMTDRGLLEGIGSLQELTTLCLTEGHNLSAEALYRFLHQPFMTSIVLLNLSECSTLDDEGLKGIAERCVHLKELDIRWCRSVTDAGISMVISHCNQLRKLSLNGLQSITGNGYLVLVPSYLPHLRELSLMNCHNVCRKFVEELKAAAPELKVWIS